MDNDGTTIKRGDIWSISEQPMYDGILSRDRPGVVVSSDKGNEVNSTVLVAFATTAEKIHNTTNVAIDCAGRETTIRCRQVQIIPQEWLRLKQGEVPPEVMRKIDVGLCVALGLFPNTVIQNIEVAYAEQKRKYEAALQVIAQQQVLLDAARLGQGAVVPMTAPKQDLNGIRQKVDVNSASIEQLIQAGFARENAEIIVDTREKRPFTSLYGVRRYLRLTDAAFAKIFNSCCVIPMEQPPAEQELVEQPEDVLHVYQASVTEMDDFFLKHGLLESNRIGFRSALAQFRKEYNGLAFGVEGLPQHPRLGVRARAKLKALEQEGRIVYD